MTSSASFGAETNPQDPGSHLLAQRGKRLLAPSSQSIDIEGCYTDFELFETRLPGFASFLGTDLGSIDSDQDSKDNAAGMSRPRLPFSRSVDDNIVFNSLHALADAYRV